MRKSLSLLIILLALALAACGGDNAKDQAAGSATPTAAEPSPTDTGSDTGIGVGEREMPGCSDPSSADCPVPLDLPLDGDVSAAGVHLVYASRYFDATTSEDPTGVVIEIVPSERNKFQDKATFQVYFADSIDAALADLQDPDSADWSTPTLTGTIGVVHDETQDPRVTTTIGAFGLDDGRAVVLKAVTTGQYGWDLYSVLYEQMLDSLTVAE